MIYAADGSDGCGAVSGPRGCGAEATCTKGGMAPHAELGRIRGRMVGRRP